MERFDSFLKTSCLRIILLVSSMIFFQPSHATTALSNAQGSCRLLVLGDSLSAAYGLDRTEGWVHLLEQRLKNKFPACELVNASISGETSLGGLSRLPALIKTHQPNLVMIELGANDGLRGLPIASMKQNLQQMVQLSVQAKAKVLLIGMEMPPNYGRTYTEQFKQVFFDTSKQNKIPLVPFLMEGFAGQREAFQADGIHPNASVQTKILGNVWPALEKLLKSS